MNLLGWLLLHAAFGTEPVAITLDEALQYAREHSPEVLATAIAPRQIAANADAARAALLPSVAGSAGAGYGNDVRARVGDGQGGSSFATNFGVTAGIPLLQLQALANARAATRQALAAEDLAAFQVEQTLAVVAARYIALQMARQSLESAHQRHLEAVRLESAAVQRVAVGTEPAVVSSRARVAAKQAELGWWNASTAEEGARLQLDQALGLPLDTPLELPPAEPLLSIAAIPEETAVEASIAEAMQRSDIRALRARRDAARATRAAAWAASLPTISGYAQLSEINGTNAFGIQSGRTAGAIGATATVPLYAGGARSANLDAAKAAEDGAELAVAIVERAAETAVRLALRTVRDASATLRVAEEAAALARDELERAERLWEAGNIDHLAVVAAQTGIANAETQREQALANYNLAVIEWRRTRGRLVPSANGPSPGDRLVPILPQE
jgi:outer membrane protein TolC